MTQGRWKQIRSSARFGAGCRSPSDRAHSLSMEEHDGGWHLQFDFNSAALPQLLNQRPGRTVLLTNRMDGMRNTSWPATPVNHK